MTGSEEKAASRVCEIDMIIRSDRGGTRCGRPIYNAPVGVDREPVCLMHSKDPNKNNEDFQAEFEHILSEAEQKRAAADFTRFIFPASDYSGRTFAPVCWFFFATFTQDVHFSWATFNLVASFSHATFIQNADFSRATFSQDARFCIFDETVDLVWARDLEPPKGSPDERNCSLIAETYQQLKRNYDAKGDYWTAGHWHYGEMEMKRLRSRFRWQWLRWLSRHFKLAALYKYASAYGESYTMPLLGLVFFVAAFAFAYPIPGLEFNPPPGASSGWLGYLDWTTFFRTHPAERPSGFWGMILHSLMTSLSVAGFQRELRYAPSYPWGRMLALLELLLTTTLGGLLLLAIRRQFKRS